MINLIIKNDDLLGRAVFSSRQAKKAQKAKVENNVFLEKPGNLSFSVDRFNLCSKKEPTCIQDKNAKLRPVKESKKRSFYGWVNIKAKIARRNNRILRASPTKANPYHAEIILPDDKNDRDAQIAHAWELASNAEPTWTSRFNGKK